MTVGGDVVNRKNGSRSNRFGDNGSRNERRSTSQPSAIGETLDHYLAYLGAPPIRTLSSLQESWTEIVGPALAEPTRPVELVDGVLIIGCDDATWASQVGWMEAQIIARFRSHFPDTEIRRIKARIGR